MNPTALLLAAIVAAVTTAAAGQDPGTPSLRDLFTTGTATLSAPARWDDAAALDEYLAALQARLRERDAAALIDGTERIIAILDQQDPRWAEAVWLRAAGNELRGDDAAVEALCRAYLNVAPAGPRAAWCQERLGMTAARRRDWATAANAWREALRLGPRPPEGAMVVRAAEAMGRAGRPRELRAALDLAEGAELSQQEADAIMFWLLDSLLLEDDPARRVPDAWALLPAPALLRRALLLERRLRHDEATTAYLALRERMDELSPPEQDLLRARLQAAGR